MDWNPGSRGLGGGVLLDPGPQSSWDTGVGVEEALEGLKGEEERIVKNPEDPSQPKSHCVSAGVGTLRRLSISTEA